MPKSMEQVVLDSPGLPARHHNVIAYGAAAQINPNIKAEGGGANMTVATLFAQAVGNMRTQENRKRLRIPQLIRGRRFATSHEWGHVGVLR